MLIACYRLRTISTNKAGQIKPYFILLLRSLSDKLKSYFNKTHIHAVSKNYIILVLSLTLHLLDLVVA